MAKRLFITRDVLKKVGACNYQRDEFARRFPGGVEFSVDGLRRAKALKRTDVCNLCGSTACTNKRGLDVDWFLTWGTFRYPYVRKAYSGPLNIRRKFTAPAKWRLYLRLLRDAKPHNVRASMRWALDLPEVRKAK